MDRDKNLDIAISKLEKFFEMSFKVVSIESNVENTIELGYGDFTEIEISFSMSLKLNIRKVEFINIGGVFNKVFHLINKILDNISFDKDGNFISGDNGDLIKFKLNLEKIDYNSLSDDFKIDFNTIFKNPKYHYDDNDDDDDY